MKHMLHVLLLSVYISIDIASIYIALFCIQVVFLINYKDIEVHICIHYPYYRQTIPLKRPYPAGYIQIHSEPGN